MLLPSDWRTREHERRHIGCMVLELAVGWTYPSGCCSSDSPRSQMGRAPSWTRRL